MMLILSFLGMYFNAAVVFVTKSLLFFILAVAILWGALLLMCASAVWRRSPEPHTVSVHRTWGLSKAIFSAEFSVAITLC